MFSWSHQYLHLGLAQEPTLPLAMQHQWFSPPAPLLYHPRVPAEWIRAACQLSAMRWPRSCSCWQEKQPRPSRASLCHAADVELPSSWCSWAAEQQHQSGALITFSAFALNKEKTMFIASQQWWYHTRKLLFPHYQIMLFPVGKKKPNQTKPTTKKTHSNIKDSICALGIPLYWEPQLCASISQQCPKHRLLLKDSLLIPCYPSGQPVDTLSSQWGG